MLSVSDNMAMKRKPKTYYMGLRTPSGRGSIKKITTNMTPKKIENKYYGSRHHFNTESSIIKISSNKALVPKGYKVRKISLKA